MTELLALVFQEVVEHPEHLIGEQAEGVNGTALAQIIGSVARSFGKNAAVLLSGEDFMAVVREALHVAVLNADELIDFSWPGTGKNLLCKILHQIVIVIEEEQSDPRSLVTRDVLLEITERALRRASR
ncbi:MAG: hypothetical protein ACI8X5_003747 [Planctomycetota bacterium]